MAAYTEHPGKYVGYGTAGFRDNAKYLPRILYRLGFIAGLRSRYFKGKTIGVMITASHNPPADNGAKVVDPLGEMLEQSWEQHVAALANAETDAEFQSGLDALYTKFGVSRKAEANVIYGRDTRASGPLLVECLEAALNQDSIHPSNFGVLTTPQLHYLVKAINTLNLPEYESVGLPTELGYYKRLSTAFRKITTLSPLGEPVKVAVDCANGVGALKLKELARYLEGLVEFEVFNDQTSEPLQLNVDCGADFVKTQQQLPANVRPLPGQLCASFDGDADRVVCYYVERETQKFRLLDGDKIATLIASFLSREVAEAQADEIEVGVVQTAYANGASTKYLERDLKIPVVCTPTGVKHLHHAALKFPIGVYFEANGHGTVLFDAQTVSRLRTMTVTCPQQKKIIDVLLALSDLINETVGDAISDLLTVIIVLALRQWSPERWDACYTDLPNRLLKANVKDRNLFKTTNAERQLVEPAGLQTKLDALMARFESGRTFVRASGTEDVVRVYSEAATQELADALGQEVLELLKEFA